METRILTVQTESSELPCTNKQDVLVFMAGESWAILLYISAAGDGLVLAGARPLTAAKSPKLL